MKSLKQLKEENYQFGHSFRLGLAVALILFCCQSCQTGGDTVVEINGDQWIINGETVLKGSPAGGLLTNVRMVNAVFEDAGPSIEKMAPGFDPEANTTELIKNMTDYYAHGIRALTISLQGGMPGYEGAVNSAFNPDGSLRQTYLDRVARVINAADEQGMVIILSCFYQRQHSHQYSLNGKEAIFNAVKNVVQWINEQNFTNVVLEVANEYAHGGYNRWKDGEWLKSAEAQVELIQHAKKTAPHLLVTTSGMGSGQVADTIAKVSDFIIIHFNRTPLSLIPERVKKARSFGKPVICNEDDKLGKLGAEAARLSVQAGAGWGFMHIDKNQSAPFEFEGAADDTTVYKMLARLATPGEQISDIPTEQFSVTITQPIDGDVFASGTPVTVRAAVEGIENYEGLEVRFFSDDKPIGKSTSAPWEITMENSPIGKYNVMAVVHGSKKEEIMRSGFADFEVRKK